MRQTTPVARRSSAVQERQDTQRRQYRCGVHFGRISEGPSNGGFETKFGRPLRIGVRLVVLLEMLLVLHCSKKSY
jgi:hypothetical protein